MRRMDRHRGVKLLNELLKELIILDTEVNTPFVHIHYKRTGIWLVHAHYRISMTRDHGYISLDKALAQVTRLIRSYALNLEPKFPRQVRL